VTYLLVVSNCEVSKITVYTDGRHALYYGSVSPDAEAEPVPGDGEGANLDSWLRDKVQRVPGQGYAQTLPSRDRNL